MSADTNDFDTSDTSDRHPTDAELRAAGFQILSRPNGTEPVWVRKGKKYVQSQAEKFMSSQIKEKS